MKQKGFSQYFVVIVLLLLGIVLINAWKKNNVEYTRAELVQDLEDGDIEEVVIHPNAQGPTGYLDVTLRVVRKRPCMQLIFPNWKSL